MSEPNILVGTDARGVATVTLNRPAIHNAFDDRLIADLTAALRRLELDPAVRVVLLTGSGKSFSAGGDLAMVEEMMGTISGDVLDAACGPGTCGRRIARHARAVFGIDISAGMLKPSSNASARTRISML